MGRFNTGTNNFTKGKSGTVIRFGERNNHLSNGPKKGLKLYSTRNDNEEVDLFTIQKKDGVIIKKSLSDIYVKSNTNEDHDCFLTFTDGNSGIQEIEADSDLIYNQSSGLLKEKSLALSDTGTLSGNFNITGTTTTISTTNTVVTDKLFE